MIKAVIFDMDGVLIDSEPLYCESDKVFFREMGLELTDRDKVAMMGCTGLVIGEYILKTYPQVTLTAQETADLHDKNINEAIVGSESLEPEPGAMDWIQKLKSLGCRLAVGSSSTYSMVRYVTDRFGITAYMDAIVTAKDVKYTKPEPDIFVKCAERLGVAPEECAVIEDTANGLLSARRAGCCRAGYAATQIYRTDFSGAEILIERFDDVNFEKFTEFYKIR